MRSIDLVSGDNDPDNPTVTASGGAEDEKEDDILSARPSEAAAASDAEGAMSGAEDGKAAAEPAVTAASEGAPAAAAAAEEEVKAAEADEPPPPRPPTRAVRVLTDEELVRRCVVLKVGGVARRVCRSAPAAPTGASPPPLQDSATKVTFQYVNRGLFNADKLTVVAQLCFKLLQDSGELTAAQVRI